MKKNSDQGCVTHQVVYKFFKNIYGNINSNELGHSAFYKGKNSKRKCKLANYQQKLLSKLQKPWEEPEYEDKLFQHEFWIEH